MSETLRRAVASAVLLSLLAAAVRLSWGTPPSQAALRLGWGTEGQRVRRPVAPDPSRPAHMQPPEGEFEFRLLPYRLVVRLDDVLRVDRLITPGGVREDRPLMVLEEIPVDPGEHRLVVEFSPAVPTTETPHVYRLQERRRFEPGRVQLVTLGAGDALVVKP